MFVNLVTSILAFVATNIDDIFILMLFYGNKRIKSSTVEPGQYLGIGTLVVISLVGAFVGSFIDQRYIGLLGLFPIYLAIKHTIDLVRSDTGKHESELPTNPIGVIAIAGVTIANGGDNIGVYIPLLTTMDYMQKIELLVVFAAMTYLWCLAARYLAERPLIARQLDKYGHVIMPIVLFFLGVFIILSSNTISLLTGTRHS